MGELPLPAGASPPLASMGRRRLASVDGTSDYFAMPTNGVS
jgi:hypothetical protein